MRISELTAPTWMRLLLKALVAIVICTSLVACNDADEPTDEKVVATGRPTNLPPWLTVKDGIDPAVWLRGREVGHTVLVSDPEVDRLRRALHQASTRFLRGSEDGSQSNRTNRRNARGGGDSRSASSIS